VAYQAFPLWQGRSLEAYSPLAHGTWVPPSPNCRLFLLWGQFNRKVYPVCFPGTRARAEPRLTLTTVTPRPETGIKSATSLPFPPGAVQTPLGCHFLGRQPPQRRRCGKCELLFPSPLKFGDLGIPVLSTHQLISHVNFRRLRQKTLAILSQSVDEFFF